LTKRATGLSDRIVELSSLEERMDIFGRDGMRVGSESRFYLAIPEGGCVSALFAATILIV